MRRAVLAALASALCAPAVHAEPVLHWRTPNAFAWTLHSIATLSLALDISTALDLKNHQNEVRSDGYTYHLVEPNPILGPHPSDAKLVGYFFAVAAIHTAIWLALPEELRWIPDSVLLLVEIPQVMGNRQNGLAFRFPF